MAKTRVDSAAKGAFAAPIWVHSMALPIWITEADGTISYLNARAEKLFGHMIHEWSGRPCHVCVRGRTRAGMVCGPRCRMRRDANAGREIEPTRMRVESPSGGREVSIVVIAVHGDEGRRLVHCVVDDERERRLQRFRAGIERRNVTAATAPAVRGRLTAREREILSLLAADLSPHEIADRLTISYTTVRNHVQHILPKLGVHSVLEAVAVWLMGPGEP